MLRDKDYRPTFDRLFVTLPGQSARPVRMAAMADLLQVAVIKGGVMVSDRETAS
ncbi:hypothetical protein VSR17_29900 [Cupriavidus taiwanensis]|uniref:hypothetical protein n=1 Tax=Cupriavidus TaxID=106589 RepID=UPI000E109281|nr:MULTISPECIES: hypothetical protein [Cupriavidus]SPD37438.1 protein of unknown function [Cupriavidus taiwanensis]